jgi:TatD DNase family protein
MIDTHAHLDFKDFDEDREDVISRFFSARGKAIINIGVDLERSRKSVEIAESHENVFASTGMHPEYFMEHGTLNMEQIFLEIKKLAKNKKVVAIGETGLDYFSHTGEIITDGQKENQKAGFLAQIEIAQELNLPVIVHCRNAWEDLFEIVSKFLRLNLKNQKFVLHCYSGNRDDTEKFLKLPNVYFSFSGNITYPKPIERTEKLAEAVRMIPLDRIMLDSDSPFLAPQEMRGKRNEPIFVEYIAKKIALIKEIGFTEVEYVTNKNAIGFFSLN